MPTAYLRTAPTPTPGTGHTIKAKYMQISRTGVQAMLRGHSVSDFADVAAHVDSYLRNVWNGTPMTAAYTLGVAFKRTLHVKNLGTEIGSGGAKN